jgi:hypothetical protein
MNKKQAIIQEFREHYMQKDGEWGYHGWVEETSFDDVEQFLSQKLDEYGEEILEAMKKMTASGDLLGATYEELYLLKNVEKYLKGQNDKD